jgi:hypothetical protein
MSPSGMFEPSTNVSGSMMCTRNHHIIKSPIPTPHNYHSPQDEDYQGPQDFARLFECLFFHTLNHIMLMPSSFIRDRNHRLCPVLQRECRLVRSTHYRHCPDLRPALDFRQWLGGEHKINEYTHNLAIAGGKRLADLLGTSVMDPEGDLTLNMVRTCSLLLLPQFHVTRSGQRGTAHSW